jgi:hypothetical protein
VNWPELLIGGLIGAVIGAALQYATIVASLYWQSRRGEWHGTWHEVLPPFNGLQERWDKIVLKQAGHRLSGTARRIHPATETNRRWRFEGYVAGSRMIGFFYLLDKKIDPASYVPVVMMRDEHSRHETIWRGFYLRPAFMSEDDILEGKATGGTMWWQRTHPSTARFPLPFKFQSEQLPEQHQHKSILDETD